MPKKTYKVDIEKYTSTKYNMYDQNHTLKDTYGLWQLLIFVIVNGLYQISWRENEIFLAGKNTDNIPQLASTLLVPHN